MFRFRSKGPCLLRCCAWTSHSGLWLGVAGCFPLHEQLFRHVKTLLKKTALLISSMSYHLHCCLCRDEGNAWQQAACEMSSSSEGKLGFAAAAPSPSAPSDSGVVSRSYMTVSVLCLVRRDKPTGNLITKAGNTHGRHIRCFMHQQRDGLFHPWRNI